MKEEICMDANVVSYIKGAKSAKNILKSSIKDGIAFSAELIILSILLLIYSGATSTLTVVLISSATLLLVVTLITKFIFVNKINDLDNNMEQSTKEYLDDSINILKLGTYTAIINIVTVTLSLITVLIMVLTILN